MKSSLWLIALGMLVTVAGYAGAEPGTRIAGPLDSVVGSCDRYAAEPICFDGTVRHEDDAAKIKALDSSGYRLVTVMRLRESRSQVWGTCCLFYFQDTASRR